MTGTRYYLVRERYEELNGIPAYVPQVLMEAESAMTLLSHAGRLVAEPCGPAWLWVWERSGDRETRIFGYCGLVGCPDATHPVTLAERVDDAIDQFLRSQGTGLDLAAEARLAGEPLDDPGWKKGPFAVDPEMLCGG